MTCSSSFNATSDYAQVTDASVIQNPFAGGGTFGAWVYVYYNPSAPYRFIDKTGGTTGTPSSGWMIYQQVGIPSKLRIYVAYTSGSGYGIWQCDTAFTDNTWTYISVTYDSDSSSNNPVFYFNGSATGTTAITSPSGSYISDSGNDIFLGGNHNGDRGFYGRICHWQLWNKVLTADEIVESMHKPGTVRDSLVGYWPGMGQDSPIRDLSGNGNTATINSVVGSTSGPDITMVR